MYVAVDDTDSVKGNCTTFLATAIIDEFADLDLIGYPRLVRLNPAVPWKTRGNGALTMRFGKGIGEKILIGNIGGRDIHCYEACSAWEPDARAMLKRIIPLVEANSEPDADPGVVVSETKPSQGFYWKGVRTILDREAAENEIERIGAIRFEMGNGRGLVGSVCAMSWRPRDRTYELLTYRPRERWGTVRVYDPSTIREAEHTIATSFNSWDEGSSKVAMVPSTPCPVMYGFRGDVPEDLMKGFRLIRTEPVERWIIFLTNQGTDDHLLGDDVPFAPNSSYILGGTVASAARYLEGGHVLIDIDTGHGPVTCAAYEPSKEFRQLLVGLRIGDEVTVMGEYRDEPRTLNLEKVHVRSLVEDIKKVSNPVCAVCGRTMGSHGKGKGFRCRRCGTRSDSPITETVPRDLAVGWYEPPAYSRRHLSKPLRRMGEVQPVCFVNQRKR